jgi:hypothetical protein
MFKGGFCPFERWANFGLRMKTGMTFRNFSRKPKGKSWWQKLKELLFEKI